MDYLSVQEYSKKWNISKRRIQVLCKEGRINGAKMIGNMWVIPEDTEKPVDARVKSPVISSNSDDTLVRKELKKFLKKLHDSCVINGMEIDCQKDYILSIIAASLCSYYLNVDLTDGLFSMIYKDIAAKELDVNLNNEDVQAGQEFIKKFTTDIELDNILSWAYQYTNKLFNDNEFSKTQFFTERYMIRYLVKNIDVIKDARKILDPCVGGGNFLVECLEELCMNSDVITIRTIKEMCSKLYGFDIDDKITRIAVVNIKLRAMAILKRNGIHFSIGIWKDIKPNIFRSKEFEDIKGALSKESWVVVNVINQEEITSKELFSNAGVVLTNPPFATIKGMLQKQKDFLKLDYPRANCDTCVAFLEAIGDMLSKDGVCGIVTQNAWMHLKTFREIREWVISNYEISKIVNLGSGAFQDLSGEKSNVALMIFSKNDSGNNGEIRIKNVNTASYIEKVKSVEDDSNYIVKKQCEINGINGFNFYEDNLFKDSDKKMELYKDIAVPMQGTSTGNAKELVGYFWEHFGDSDWTSVSNGGGYSRWQGLNDSVVKWRDNGEYIKEQKGSALRNVKYFEKTQMVFSDTGTAGLNVRLLHDGQIFIASGPGIRIKKGSEYAHLALLNSRIASYYIRLLSPKLTIAAGYIGQIPVSEDICSSVVLEKNARLCVELKEKMLSTRPSNMEYSDSYISSLPDNIEKASWKLFNEDITNELMKLEVEARIDDCLMENFGFSEKAKKTLDSSVGKCAYEIVGSEEIDLLKLDKYIDKIIDSNCWLKRTKNSKNALGSDGYIEYAAKDLNISPETIVRKIQENPYKLVRVLEKYKNLLFHNYVLYCMGYSTQAGVKRKRADIDDFKHKYNKSEFQAWIKRDFNKVHADIFKGKPYLIYSKGEVYVNDQITTK